MIRETQPQPDDSSHDRMIFVMQSARERDEYARTFPNPIPDTHELTATWDDTGMHLVLALRPRVEAQIAGRAARTRGAGGRLAEVVNAARKELDKLTKADLMIKAAEYGLGDKLPSSATKPEIIAQVLRRMDEEGHLDPEADEEDDDE